MKRLQDLIISLGAATAEEINQALYDFPNSGVIEGLSFTLGRERESAILRKVAEALKVPLLKDGAVKPEESIAEFELDGLVATYKAMPLAIQSADGSNDATPAGTRIVVLAITDPLNDEAIKAFSTHLNMPLRLCLARESAILSAFTKLQSQRPANQGARSARLADLRAQAQNVRQMGDTEVLKAMQQVIATAIKHSVEEVEIRLDYGFTRASFKVKGSTPTVVDISVSPHNFAANLLSRAQLVERDQFSTKFVARVEFKALTVDCHVELINNMTLDESGSGLETPTSILRLSGFLVDAPENPRFWFSLTELAPTVLRRVLALEPGIVVVVSPKEHSRELALRALADLNPDCEVILNGSEETFNDSTLAERAKARHVIIGVDAIDHFPVMEWVLRSPAPVRDALRCFFSYYEVPRVCVSCDVSTQSSEKSGAGNNIFSFLPEYFQVSRNNFRHGQGCPICLKQGNIGWMGAGSVVDVSGKLRKFFNEGVSVKDVTGYLALMDFQTVFENGLLLAESGLVSLDSVFSDLPRPPAEYEFTKGTPQAATALENPKFDDGRLQLPDDYFSSPGARHGREVEGSIFREAAEAPVAFEEPLRDRDAMTGRKTAEETAGGSSSRLPIFPSLRANGKSTSPAEPKQQLPVAVAVEGKGKVLLVIDDDPDQREILRKVLELEGFRVEVAADGVDGIVTAAKVQPSLIIVDFMMPDLDGKETIRRLRRGETTSKIPIVALTAYADPNVECSLLEAGANDFCSKSVAKKVLLKRIDRLVSSS